MESQIIFPETALSGEVKFRPNKSASLHLHLHGKIEGSQQTDKYEKPPTISEDIYFSD